MLFEDVLGCFSLVLMFNGKELWLELPLPGGRGNGFSGNELTPLWLHPYRYLDWNAWV